MTFMDKVVIEGYLFYQYFSGNKGVFMNKVVIDGYLFYQNFNDNKGVFLFMNVIMPQPLSINQ